MIATVRNLAEDKPPSVRKPSRLKLAPEVALDDSFSIILRGCFQHLLQAMPTAEDGRNPEYRNPRVGKFQPIRSRS